MPIKPSEVIGEGSYGCIHKPSLICKDKKTILYKNKISKLLLSKHAVSELKEYMLIAEIDKKNDFFLGMPDICKVKLTNISLKSAKKCKKITKKNNGELSKSDLQNYSLLVMNYGGIDLEKYGLTFKNILDTQVNINKAINLWKETARLFNGIHTFQKHNVMHFDIKPQNIVYDKKKNRINFIDFGHMRKISDSIFESTNSSNGLTSEAFWNYPFEIQFLNQDNFLKVAYLTSEERNQWFVNFQSNISLHSDDSFVIAYETFIDIFTENLSQVEKDQIESVYQTDFFATLNEQIMIENYDSFLEKSTNTVDTYGIGISLRYLLNYTRHLLPEEFNTKISELCYFITTPDLSKRYTIEDIIDKYPEIIALL